MAKKQTVKYAKLHQGIHVPGVGTIGDVLPPNNKTFDYVDMYKANDGLRIDLAYRGVKASLMVPSANVIVMDLGPEVEVAD